jgi:hypothetical protein
MVRWEGNKLHVGYHEWAWSQRTQGFPVYAVLGEEVIKIGETTKRPWTYIVPQGTIAVVRRYETNKGYTEYHVYLPGGEHYVIDEKSDYNIPEELPETVRKALSKWLGI